MTFLLLSALASMMLWAAEPAPIEIIRYYETSIASGSEGIRCALEGNCKKAWSPAQKDSGSLEGFFLELPYFIFNVNNTAEPMRETILLIEFSRKIEAPCSKISYFVHGLQFSGFSYSDESVSGYCPILLPKDYQGSRDKPISRSVFVRLESSTDAVSIKRVRFLQSGERSTKKNRWLVAKNEIKPLRASDPLPEKLTNSYFNSRCDDDDCEHPDEKGWPSLFIEMPILLPGLLSVKDLKTSSQLEPKLAYQPANLFDGSYASAFAFNGKKNNGKGESLGFEFSEKGNIAGIKIWNGYQRSEAHFKANSRIKSLEISSGSQTETIDLPDSQEPQVIPFKTPLSSAQNLKLTVKEIYPGEKYPDLVISELNFLSEKQKPLIAAIPRLQPTQKYLAAILDRTWDVGDKVQKKDDPRFELTYSSSFRRFEATLRIRSNGSFVMYTHSISSAVQEKENVEKKSTIQDRKAKSVRMVLEGNWDPTPEGARLFGKKYFVQNSKEEGVELKEGGLSGYSVLDNKNDKLEEQGLFQTYVKIRRAESINGKEKENLAKFFKEQHTELADKDWFAPGRWIIEGNLFSISVEAVP